MTLTSKQRAALRGASNGLLPIFQIGKAGVDDPLVISLKTCLAKRELVKIRLLETSPISAQDAAEQLARRCKAQVIQVIGRVVVLFKRKSKESAFNEILHL